MIPFKNWELPKFDLLRDNLYSASFFLMKLMPARYIIESSLKSGELREGMTVIETTSGTFGLALAMICAEMKIPLKLVSDPAITPEFKRRIELLGAEIHIISVDNPEKYGGYQPLRLKKIKEFLDQGNYFWPNQYDNLNNQRSYFKLAEYISDNFSKLDYIIGPVGSGGSMNGLAIYLKNYFPHLKFVGVDTPNSILFGQRNGKRELRGLGNSILPANHNINNFDLVTWVPPQQAYYYTRELYREHGLFMGPTSGAAYSFGQWLTQKNKNCNVLCIFPDEGYRYFDTVYNDEWIMNNRYNIIDSNDLIPKEVYNPMENIGSWTYKYLTKEDKDESNYFEK